jgi:hypothetical protein
MRCFACDRAARRPPERIDNMNHQTHSTVHDIPIGIRATGVRSLSVLPVARVAINPTQ